MRLQGTVKSAVVFRGKGIHSGKDVRLTIKKAPVDTGIIFIRKDLNNRPAIEAKVLNLARYSGSYRCTSLRRSKVVVSTIEHLMAALSGLNIDNVEIEINSEELPALDGSALEYAIGIQKAGILEQKKKKKELFFKKVIICHNRDALLIAIPNEGFRISYLLRYDDLSQCADFYFDTRNKKDIFLREIAPARTFCFEKEAAEILKKGLGKGATYKKALVLRNGKPIGNKFRFTNEPASHKVLDLMGDLAILGAELKAHIIGIRSGHSLNRELLGKLSKLL